MEWGGIGGGGSEGASSGRLAQAVFLSGFMGAGKSRVGRLLAARTGAPFVDLDEAVERAAGLTIRELVRQRGEAAFRAIERELLLRELEAEGRRVVSLGGGSLLDPALRRRALERGLLIVLRASPEILAGRLAGDQDRPLLAGGDRLAKIRALLEERRAAYDEAHAQIDTGDADPEGVVDRILALDRAEITRSWRGGKAGQ